MKLKLKMHIYVERADGESALIVDVMAIIQSKKISVTALGCKWCPNL